MAADTEEQRQCLNCDNWSPGDYCCHCGQKLDLSVSTRGFFAEALPKFVSRDGSFPRTLKLLLFNPGRLTRRFHAGKRTRYNSPISMLLSAIFLLFTMPLLAGLVPTDKQEETKIQAENLREVKRLDAEISQYEAQLKSASGEAREDLLDDLEGTVFVRNVSAKIAEVPAIPDNRYAHLFEQDSDPDENWIDAKFSAMGDAWKRNPELKILSLRNTLIKYSWVLVPLTLPAMFLSMPGGYRNRFKHAVFAGYSLAFMLFLIALFFAAVALGVNPLSLSIGLGSVALAHLFVQTKNAYRLSWLVGIFRFLMILICIGFAIILFIILLFLLNLI